jgi:hypothetical protein
MHAHLRQSLLVLSLALAGVPAYADPPPHRTDPALQARVQAALPRQPALLDEALKRIAPQRAGVRDLYFVGFAGYGDQDVFRKEVERVRALFDARFGTAGRSLILVNHLGTLERHPLATLRNLRQALAAIGRRLDPEEDMLFLFVTSHGDRKHGAAVQLNGRNLGAISPARLAEALKASGIQKRVIVVSACYSGQFIPALKSDDTLVITASSANRPSFGCSTDAEWTWFGESYFVDALPKAGKFVEAFARARQSVRARETKENERPSLPQISLGPRIALVLKELGY